MSTLIATRNDTANGTMESATTDNSEMEPPLQGVTNGREDSAHNEDKMNEQQLEAGHIANFDAVAAQLKTTTTTQGDSQGPQHFITQSPTHRIVKEVKQEREQEEGEGEVPSSLLVRDPSANGGAKPMQTNFNNEEEEEEEEEEDPEDPEDSNHNSPSLSPSLMVGLEGPSPFPFSFDPPRGGDASLTTSSSTVPLASWKGTGSTTSAHPILPEGFQMSIAVQPPLKTVYQRILKPFPAISLTVSPSAQHQEFSESTFDGLFVEATLLRGDNGVPLPKCIDGNCLVRFEKRNRSWSEGLYAAFKKLKILSTSQQLQGTLLRLKFTLKRYSGNSFATVQVPNCSVISHPIEVFSHTQYLNKSKEGIKTGPTLPAPQFDYFPEGAQKKRRDWRKSSDRTYDRATHSTLTSTSVNIPTSSPSSSASVSNSTSTTSSVSNAPSLPAAATSECLSSLAAAVHLFKEAGGNYHMAIDVLNQVFGFNTGAAPASSSNPVKLTASGIDRVPIVFHPSNSLPVPASQGKSMLKSTSASLSTLASSGSTLPRIIIDDEQSTSGLDVLAFTSAQSSPPVPESNTSWTPSESSQVTMLMTELRSGKIVWDQFTQKLFETVGKGKAMLLITHIKEQQQQQRRRLQEEGGEKEKEDSGRAPMRHTTGNLPTLASEALSKTTKQSPPVTRQNSGATFLPPERKHVVVEIEDSPDETPQPAKRGRKRKNAIAKETDIKDIPLSVSSPSVPNKKVRGASRGTRTGGDNSSSLMDVPPELLLSSLSSSRSTSPTSFSLSTSSSSIPIVSGPSPPPAIVAFGQPTTAEAAALTQFSTSSPEKSQLAVSSPPGSPSKHNLSIIPAGMTPLPLPVILPGPITPPSLASDVTSTASIVASAQNASAWYHLHEGKWEAFNDEVSGQLEKNYAQHNTCYLTLDDVQHKFDFRAMTRARVDLPKLVTHIRRGLGD